MKTKETGSAKHNMLKKQKINIVVRSVITHASDSEFESRLLLFFLLVVLRLIEEKNLQNFFKKFKMFF